MHKLRTWADCIRANGLAGWPDPDGDGIFHPDPMPAEDDPNWRKADTACRSLEPGPIQVDGGPGARRKGRRLILPRTALRGRMHPTAPGVADTTLRGMGRTTRFGGRSRPRRRASTVTAPVLRQRVRRWSRAVCRRPAPVTRTAWPIALLDPTRTTRFLARVTAV